MIRLKSKEEIEAMREGGLILKKAVKNLLPHVKPGITTSFIDEEAERLVIKYGAESSFNKVPGYQWTTCLPIDEQVVHTPPSNRILKEGDMLTIDMGAYYKGLHVDWATTILIGPSTDKKKEKFLSVGKIALNKAIEQVILGNRIGHISKAIQQEIYGNGYFILRELTGHGVGKDLHEDPYIPGILVGPLEKTAEIVPGMVFAVEVIYSMGTEDIIYEEGDDWSIVTRDGSLSACFEETVAVTENKTFILT